ncbi:hypothetical protein AV530_015543 [Patagioenas fasciata monilis]|uniref:Uncharacterized protein n=1 Tax=Patagioenas fasciata monilis TaxID=372326 RepID=A0A1V4KHR7_PATFA|nr:hypothetical protein AV530_015543 [Patagioenas fasciata monilis]
MLLDKSPDLEPPGTHLQGPLVLDGDVMSIPRSSPSAAGGSQSAENSPAFSVAFGGPPDLQGSGNPSPKPNSPAAPATEARSEMTESVLPEKSEVL